MSLDAVRLLIVMNPLAAAMWFWCIGAAAGYLYGLRRLAVALTETSA